jgi:ankyrin repeat protein
VHSAAQNGHEIIVRLLLDNSTEKDKENKDENTLLLIAALNNHESVVQLLIEMGAAVQSCDNDGWTAIQKVLLRKQTGSNKIL